MRLKHLIWWIFVPAALFLPILVSAQNLFSPAIIVNDKSITYYELVQRKALLNLLKSAGNLHEVAKNNL